MKTTLKILAAAFFATIVSTVEARNLKIVNNVSMKLEIKQINLKGKDIFDKPTGTTQAVLGTIQPAKKEPKTIKINDKEVPTPGFNLSPVSSSYENVTNEPFTLQFQYTESTGKRFVNPFNLDIQSGKQDDNKDIVIEDAKRIQ